jgi:hypothetical protein
MQHSLVTWERLLKTPLQMHGHHIRAISYWGLKNEQGHLVSSLPFLPWPTTSPYHNITDFLKNLVFEGPLKNPFYQLALWQEATLSQKNLSVPGTIFHSNTLLSLNNVPSDLSSESVIKVKIPSSLPSRKLASDLAKLCFDYPHIKWRFDNNCSWQKKDFFLFLQLLGDQVDLHQHLDYFENPFPLQQLSEEEWQNKHLFLASDEDSQWVWERFRSLPLALRAFLLKPTLTPRLTLELLKEDHPLHHEPRLIITSAFDGPECDSFWPFFLQHIKSPPDLFHGLDTHRWLVDTHLTKEQQIFSDHFCS